ncbi:adenine nucleotide alpha hydrolases-like protein [Rhizoclosmatium globosum]|uniref:Adenine nucleotide alpha hydrolases-like protein n=1 Tax=Rhizoclosmatium globosum TaxID=329046 RepID=A0A1Y2BR64_9FUNG|nr:adenine nucleotide alpha hydrolases-like protein [Rhizoclosmatium globosum]|eukprot:ORY37239.1 adenine nucleotide alpha hydrolases-like protein [Rhizoclosmatium globosum]
MTSPTSATTHFDLENFNPDDWKKDIVAGRIICVAIDGSDDGSKAFYWALNNLIKPSTGINNKLVLLTCIPASAPDSARLESNALLKKYVDLVKAANLVVPLRAILLKGEVRTQLCDIAVELKADLFVIGTRGLGALKRAVLGSVSDYVSKNCECTVVIAK